MSNQVMQAIKSIFILSVLLLNRWAAKISFGPVYLLDATILLSFFLSTKKWLYFSVKLFPAVIMVAYGLGWLLHDFLDGRGADQIFLRRFALAFYFLVPVMMLASFRHIRISFASLILVFLVSIIGLLSLYKEGVFRVSLLAEVLGFLVLYFTLLPRKSGFEWFFLVVVLLFFLVSIVHPYIVGSGGIYKTPLAAFVLSLSAVYSILFGKRLIRGRAPESVYYIAPLFLLSVILFLFVTDMGRLIVSEFVTGISGLMGWDVNPVFFEWGGARDRASSFGTASTRTDFWVRIIEYALDDMWRFIFGNGHILSFMEAIPGDYCIRFPDCELIEPHNSFVGVFFRYGIVGVFLLVLLMWRSRKIIGRSAVDSGVNFRTASAVYAIVYASFEVVLESPHGAVLFWFFWLAPTLLDRRSWFEEQWVSASRGSLFLKQSSI